jgi:hypothetical protein
MQFYNYFFPRNKVCINFGEKYVGPHFGRLLHKLIPVHEFDFPDEFVKLLSKTLSRPIFAEVNTLLLFTVEKSCPQNWAASAIFKKLPKEKNRPLGKNSPNLVTLSTTHLPMDSVKFNQKNIDLKASSPCICI